MTKKKIIFVLPSLVAGGAERVLSFLAQKLNPHKFIVQLLVTGERKNDAYATGRVKVTYLEKKRVLSAIPEIFLFLRATKPDIVFSSLAHLNTVMGLTALVFRKTKFIIRPTNIQLNTARPRSLLSKISISQIDKAVCQSHDMAENFRQITNIPLHKVVVIGNPITNLKSALPNKTINGYRKLITVGRLNKVKGHERILNLLAKLNFDFQYTIIGDGPEKEPILQTIRKLDLESKVLIVPFTDQVDKHLGKSDLFLQGSYSEGFPNAVLESCTLGIPVLAFNVPGGTKEIIQHEINGYLAESEEEFLYYLNLKRVWNCSEIRDSVVSKFSENMVVASYEKLFLSVAQ